MYRAVSATAGPRRYNIEPITDNQSVHWALLHSYARDPEYVKAVLRSYIEVKKSRGRLSNDISLKLNYLEQQVPQYAESFHAVRAEYRLPPSRVLPSSTITPLSPTISRLSSQQRRSPPRSPRRSTERRTSTSSAALPPEFQVRPAPAPEDELPPPPYARQDPEPDSTRLLQERLAAEASANLPPDTRLVFPTSPRRASHAGTGISRPTSQMGQGSTAGDSPARRSTQTPPTTSSPANENRSRRSSNRPISPPHPPEDDEIARAYEENALEEAKRASILAEQERKELEEAMRLSLAEPMPEAGPSQWESLAPTRTPGPRRVVSDISGSSFTAGPSRPGPSLLDSDDQMEGFKPLVPQKTGAVMQSRNPFLSASENTTPPRDQAGSSRTLFTGRALPPLPVSSQLHPARQAELPEKQRHDMGLVPEYPSQPEQSSSHLPVQATLEPPHISDNTDLLSADNQYTAQQDGGDPLHSLSYYSTVFLIDDAPSMAGEPWNKAKSAFTQVAETAMKYAEDGIDVYFTNSKRVGRELKTSDDIEELLSGLQARGAGSIGYRLQTILREYMERLTTIDSMSPGRQRREVKPMILIVVTDGACALQMVQRKNQQEYSVPRPDMLDHSAEDDLESVIVACARELDNAQHPASQIGIQFLQIGNNTEAREALEHLDNGIAELHGVRDMVDMVVYDQDGMPVELIRKTLFGGIDRNWDNYNV